MSRGLDEQLICAADAGDIAGCCAAIAAGADVHAEGDRALRWAASRGHTALVTALLAAGADVNARGGASLRIAAWYGHLDVARLLIRASARVDNVFVLTSEGNPEGLGLLLDTPACMSEEDTAQLRAAVLADASERLEPLRQRLLLQEQAARTTTPELEMP